MQYNEGKTDGKGKRKQGINKEQRKTEIQQEDTQNESKKETKEERKTGRMKTCRKK